MKNLARVLVSLLLFVALTISLPVVDRFGIRDGRLVASTLASPTDVRDWVTTRHRHPPGTQTKPTGNPEPNPSPEPIDPSTTNPGPEPVRE